MTETLWIGDGKGEEARIAEGNGNVLPGPEIGKRRKRNPGPDPPARWRAGLDRKVCIYRPCLWNTTTTTLCSNNVAGREKNGHRNRNLLTTARGNNFDIWHLDLTFGFCHLNFIHPGNLNIYPTRIAKFGSSHYSRMVYSVNKRGHPILSLSRRKMN